MTRIESVNAAKELGKQAFEEGKTCVPYQEATLKQLAEQVGQSIWTIYEVYTEAWNEAQQKAMNQYLQEIKNTK